MSMWVEPSCNLYRAIFTEHWVNDFRWGFKRERDMRLHPRRSRAILVLANPNVSPGKGNSNKEVIMVDPLEAKRLASKQMAQIKAKERLGKQHKIEAINGAWAMIGLTAGLVIEGVTGKSIMAQVRSYLYSFTKWVFLGKFNKVQVVLLLRFVLITVCWILGGFYWAFCEISLGSGSIYG
ncbi:uncharacterized protein [Primulina huaijiensis]|uniref:uncharacterized protein isoform X2 n=1 Tax=Primulina huaijiensis TaxID=1492673 RepID=UPI003CC6F148